MNKATNDSPVFSHHSDYVAVGKIRGVWGLRGDLRVEVLTAFPERFAIGSVLYLEGSPARVIRSRPAKKGLIVGLDIVADRTVAESLRGSELAIPLEEVNPLPEGSYYHFQLLGIDVLTEDGDSVGTITDIISTEGNDVYVVTAEDSKEVLIPALKELILDVSVDKNRMIVKLPEYV